MGLAFPHSGNMERKTQAAAAMKQQEAVIAKIEAELSRVSAEVKDLRNSLLLLPN